MEAPEEASSRLSHATEPADALEAELAAALAKDAGSLADPSAHWVVEGDSMECAAYLARRGLDVQAIVTSPPYNASMDYAAGFDDRKPAAHYVQFLERFLRAAHAVLANGGYLVVNLRDVKRPHRPDARAETFLRERLGDALGYVHAGTITWIKENRRPPRTDRPDRASSWEPGERHERVFFFRKPGIRARPGPLLVEGGFLRACPSWHIPSVRKTAGADRANVAKHPCPYPVELPFRAIKACTCPGDRVFDPFGGIGTTSLAAARAGRSSVCMDRNPSFCQVAFERLVGELARQPHVSVRRDAAGHAASVSEDGAAASTS